MEGGLLQQVLDGEGQILWRSLMADSGVRGGPEAVQELPGQPAALAVVREPGQVDPEQPVRGPLDQVGQLTNELVAAVGGQPHRLALVRVGLEAEEPGEGRVDLAQGVGVAHLGQPGQPRPAPTWRVVDRKSPPRSRVSTAAWSNGLGKKALAAWASWWPTWAIRPR